MLWLVCTTVHYTNKKMTRQENLLKKDQMINDKMTLFLTFIKYQFKFWIFLNILFTNFLGSSQSDQKNKIRKKKTRTVFSRSQVIYSCFQLITGHLQLFSANHRSFTAVYSRIHVIYNCFQQNTFNLQLFSAYQR